MAKILDFNSAKRHYIADIYYNPADGDTEKSKGLLLKISKQDAELWESLYIKLMDSYVDSPESIIYIKDMRNILKKYYDFNENDKYAVLDIIKVSDKDLPDYDLDNHK